MADAQITSGQKLKSTANTRDACVANYLEKQERVQPSELNNALQAAPTQQAQISRSYQKQKNRSWPSASWVVKCAGKKDGKIFPMRVKEHNKHTSTS